MIDFQSTINVRENWCPDCIYGNIPCFRYIPHDGNCLYYKKVDVKKKKRLSDGAVDWYIPGRKNPFARTDKKDAELIYYLYSEEKDLRKVLDRLVCQSDAYKVVKSFIDRKIYKLEV